MGALNQEQIVNKILDRVHEMPPISSSTLAILELLNEKDYKSQDLVRLVSTDVTLTSRCLQTINSPAFGMRQKVTSIDRAVNLLGGQAIANMALKTTLNQVMPGDLVGYSSSKDDLWAHCLRAAIGARLIAPIIDESLAPDIVYTAGLLHDLGKLVISDFLEETSAGGFPTDIIRKEGFLAAEKKLVGTNHAIVGAALTRKWGIPEPLPTLIEFHHQPANVSESLQTACVAVHLGDICAMLGGAGTGVDNMSYPIDPIVTQYIQRDASWELKTLPKLLLNIDMEAKSATQFSNQSGGIHV